MQKPQRSDADLSEKKLLSQIKLAETVLRTVICAAFGAGKPADRVLSAFFRENRSCGARDRAFLSETVFAVWRNWGIITKAFAPGRAAAIERGESGPTTRELGVLVAGALYLENIHYPAVRMLELKMPKAAPGADLAERGRLLLRELGVAADVSAADLVPEWVRTRLSGSFDLDGYLAFLSRRPPMWLRSQHGDPAELVAALSRLGLAVSRHPRLPDAIKVENAKVNVFTLPEFRAGQFEVQDLASQVIGRVAAPGKGERWLDICAGAGGKTLQLAELLERSGSVLAMDIRAYKLDDLRQRARRAAFPNIRTQEWDGKKLKRQLREKFDGVLVDAPCSCSGVWRRNPDGRWTLKSDEIAEMAKLQLEILNHASNGVKPDGVLIYATCSIFPEENTGVVDGFVASHPEFEPEAFTHPLNGSRVESGMLQVLPGDGDCDAMFVARFRRKQVQPDSN
jgi:16S rRNA (cytosine967-C5)-methyltransferase